MKDDCVEKLRLQNIKEVTKFPARDNSKETSLKKSNTNKDTSISIKAFLARVV